MVLYMCFALLLLCPRLSPDCDSRPGQDPGGAKEARLQNERTLWDSSVPHVDLKSLRSFTDSSGEFSEGQAWCFCRCRVGSEAVDLTDTGKFKKSSNMLG